MNTVRLAKLALLHPITFFEDIQERAKWHYAFVMIGLAILAHYLSLTFSGFLFQTREPYQISILIESMWIVVPWLTWSVTNWGVSSIMDGEGKFKQIFVGSAFTLIPYITLSVPVAIVSNLLAKSEAMMYNGLEAFIFVWVVYLILLQVKIIHDFTFGKMLWITLLTIIGMFIIWFIGMLLYGLINQSIQFVIGLYKEINYRL
ncbi:YIP1 family protein [Paenibacillus azoreducens]|uniref:YIP1 family protein n=1 Tax=Paenibacillus azoreducens TaxID=116718 RepID=UPI0039F4BBFB